MQHLLPLIGDLGIGTVPQNQIARLVPDLRRQPRVRGAPTYRHLLFELLLVVLPLNLVVLLQPVDILFDYDVSGPLQACRGCDFVVVDLLCCDIIYKLHLQGKFDLEVRIVN